MFEPGSPVRPSEADWRGLALKAAGTLDRLATRTDDGLTVDTLPPRRVDVPRAWRLGGTREGWSIAQRIDDPDPERANASALDDLAGGADALTLVFAGGASARGHGIVPGDLPTVLSGVELDLISLRLDGGTPVAIAALAELVGHRRLASAGLAVDCGFDPIGTRARRGAAPTPADDDLAPVLAIARSAGFAGRVLLADGRPYHEAGAGAAQELAAVVATGVAYLRRLAAAGLPVAAASATIGFCLAVDADVFEGLAKVRAMRRLWARIEQAAGVTPRPIRLHAETAWRAMARRDPWTNVMRATAGAMAAGLGGADCVSVLPHTLALGLPDAQARRLARNIGRVLIDESRLGFVEDPAAGAGGPEALTEALCEGAWGLFQQVEREGGVEASLEAGLLQARIAVTAATRADDVAHGRRGVVGTNLFPCLVEADACVLARAPLEAPAAPDALPSRRDAAPFEALRDAAERLARRPTVVLATLGAPAAFGPRGTAAANAFAAAGMEASIPGEQRDASHIVERFTASGAVVACLCGPDEVYATEAAPLARALKAAGARRVILAGDPGEATAEWRLAGVDAFLHDGCALLALLEDALRACTEGAMTEPARP